MVSLEIRYLWSFGWSFDGILMTLVELSKEYIHRDWAFRIEFDGGAMVWNGDIIV